MTNLWLIDFDGRTIRPIVKVNDENVVVVLEEGVLISVGIDANRHRIVYASSIEEAKAELGDLFF